MIVTAGKTNVTVDAYFVDDDGGAAPGEPTTGLLFSDIETGGSASYHRQGAARVDFTLVTQTVAGAHTDGGFVLVDDTNMPGDYRLDVPDAAFATGVDYVVIQLVAAAANNTVMRPLLIDLTDVDLRDSVRGGMTALPNAAAEAAGGLYTRGTGAGQINQPTNGQIDSNVVAMAANVLTAAAIASNAISAAKIASNAFTSAKFATGAIGADAIAADAIGASEFSQAAADKVWSSATRTLTAFSTTLALSIWHVLESAVVTASTMGLKVKNNLDVVVSTRATPAQVNTEVDTALADVNLDHLIGTATGIPAVPAGTFFDQMFDDGTATFNRTTDSLQAIRDRGDAAWTTGAGGTPPDLLQSTTIATLASQVSFTLTAGSVDDDAYNNQIVVVTDSTTGTQKAVGRVSDYVGSTRTVTLEADPGIFTMAVGDAIDIIAVNNHITTADTATTVTNQVTADTTAISGSTTAADNLQRGAEALVLGAAVGTPTTTVIDTDLTETTTDHYKTRIVTFTTGNIAGQASDITAYNGTTKELTVTALTDAPSAGDVFVIS